MLVDSNILIYAINSASPKHKTAQKFLQEKIGELEIAHQNIFETLRVLTHKKFPSPMRPKEAIAAVGRITKVCKIISPDYKTHHIALELVGKYNLGGDKIFDAYLAATALANDIAIIATDNSKDFQQLREITVFNPFKTP